jgi:hypothetical protein
MTPSNRSWQSLLTALPSDPVEEARTLTLRTLTLPRGVGTRSKMIDVNRLSAAERSLLDDGDLIPAWAQYWLTLAQALCELSRQRSQAAVVIIPHESASHTQVLDLTVREVCAALANSAFAHPAGVILAWGVPPDQVNKPRFPLSCAGAITTTVDGLAAVLLSTEEDATILADWFD